MPDKWVFSFVRALAVSIPLNHQNAGPAFKHTSCGTGNSRASYVWANNTRHPAPLSSQPSVYQARHSCPGHIRRAIVTSNTSKEGGPNLAGLWLPPRTHLTHPSTQPSRGQRFVPRASFLLSTPHLRHSHTRTTKPSHKSDYGRISRDDLFLSWFSLCPILAVYDNTQWDS